MSSLTLRVGMVRVVLAALRIIQASIVTGLFALCNPPPPAGRSESGSLRACYNCYR